MGAGDSKAQFKSHLNLLMENNVHPQNHDFWSVMFTSSLSIEEIFALVSPKDVRVLRKKQPQNLATTIYKCTEQLYLFAQPQNYNAEFTSAQNSIFLLSRMLPFVFEHNDDGFIDLLFFENSIPYIRGTEPKLQPKTSSSVEGTSEATSSNNNKPPNQANGQEDQKADKDQNEKDKQVVSEEQTDNDVKENGEEEEAKKKAVDVEEKKTETEEAGQEGNEKKKEVVIKSDEEEIQQKEPTIIATTSDIQTSSGDKVKVSLTISNQDERPLVGQKFKTLADDVLKVSLAEAMVSTIIQVFYLPGFSIPIGQLPIDKNEKAREKELLKGYPEGLRPFLLWEGGICIGELFSYDSEQMQHRIDALRCLLSLFSRSLYFSSEQCMKNDNRFLTLATTKSSHIATTVISMLNVIFSYDPSSYLPYTSVLMSDPKERFIEMSIHTLILLLHHKPDSNNQQTNRTNLFADCVKKITSESDLKFLCDGFISLLNNVVEANNTYLPNSQKLISFYEEILVLLWKLLDLNPAFKKYLCGVSDITKILVPLLYIFQTSSKDHTKFPLLQLCSFILLLLSAQREFGVALNRVFDVKAPLETPVFSGNYSDLLIIVIHKAIATDKAILRPLFDCLLTVICNISPYCKTLSMVTSIKLLNLFEAFTSPKFLYAGEKHPLFVSLLLETFNNLVQYQYEGNVHLVYSILRRKKVFWDLYKPVNIQDITALIEKKSQRKEPTIPKFTPTQEWVQSWKKDLPLDTLLTLLKSLTPEIENLCSKDLATEDDVISFLKSTTLVGLLPVPHTIVIRTFQSNQQIDVFLTTYLWGLIFLKNNRETPLFDSTAIKLFSVNVI